MMCLTLRTAVCAVLTVAATTALAAEGADVAKGGLEEIVVTAQKREENVQRVPISLTALDAATLERSHARDIQGVAQLAPNVIIDPTLGNGTASIAIRGMQLNDVEKSFDPAVSVYLDGIYLASSTGALLQLFDSADVEVLRGPQGTLWGKNTIGGLIAINRAMPTGDFGGKLGVTYGRFDQLDVNAVLNLGSAFDGRLKTKVAFISQTGGGYFKNQSLNPGLTGKQEGNTEFQGFTSTTTLRASDAIDMSLILDYFNDHTPTRPVTSITGPLETFCGVYGANCGAPASDTYYHSNSHTVQPQPAYLHTAAATYKLNWHITEGQKLVSLTGYRRSNEDAIQEFDGASVLPGSPAWPGGTPVFITDRQQWAHQLSEELRLESDWSKSLRSTLGAFAYFSEYNIHQNTFIFGSLNNFPDFRQTTHSDALFGQVDWDFAPAWTLSVGGRYTSENKDVCGTQTNIAPASFVSFGSCTNLGNYEASYVDPVTGKTINQDGKKTWTKFTPRVNVQWRFDEGKLAYLTYSEGFRSGGFNGRSTDVNTLGPYQPESVKSFELGLKSQWLDNRLRANVDVFHTKYNNKQEDVVFPAGNNSTVTLVQNAGSATLNGGELEVTFQPVRGFTAAVNVGVLDAKYDSFEVPGLSGGIVDKSSFKLRRAPRFTGGVNLQYEQPVTSSANIVYGANYSYKSDYYVVANTLSAYNVNPQGGFNSNPGHIGSFGDLDLNVSYDMEKFKFTLWGKNLTDERHFVHVLDVGSNYNAGAGGQPVPVPGLWTFGTLNAPRTYGVSATMKF